MVCNPSPEDLHIKSNGNYSPISPSRAWNYLTQSTSKVIVVFFVYSYTVPLILYRIQLNQLYTYYKALTCPCTFSSNRFPTDVLSLSCIAYFSFNDGSSPLVNCLVFTETTDKLSTTYSIRATHSPLFVLVQGDSDLLQQYNKFRYNHLYFHTTLWAILNIYYSITYTSYSVEPNEPNITDPMSSRYIVLLQYSYIIVLATVVSVFVVYIQSNPYILPRVVSQGRLHKHWRVCFSVSHLSCTTNNTKALPNKTKPRSLNPP